MQTIKCIALYPEVYLNSTLTPNEKYYISVVRYFTMQGRTHICTFSDEQMADELEMSVLQIRKIKSILKKQGLITITDKGIIYNNQLTEKTTDIKYIIIQPDIYSNSNLSYNEKIYLSVIRYYTEEGKTNCCKLSDKNMSNELGISLKSVQNMKCKFKGMGILTATNDGIKYNNSKVSVDNISLDSNEVSLNSNEVSLNSNEVSLNSNEVSLNSNEVSLNSNEVSLNSNEKFYKYIENQKVTEVKEEKKELKKTKEEKEPVKEFETNFDLIFSRVRENYRTEENKTYLIDNFKDKVDYFNNMSKKDLNEDLGSIVDIFNSTLSIKLNSEAIKNSQKNKERDLIEKKKESGLFDLGEVF